MQQQACRLSWPLFAGHESLLLFLRGYLKDCVHRTNPQTVLELRAEIENVAEKVICDTLRDTVDSFMARLQRVN
jgi:hypothetical protein